MFLFFSCLQIFLRTVLVILKYIGLIYLVVIAIENQLGCSSRDHRRLEQSASSSIGADPEQCCWPAADCMEVASRLHNDIMACRMYIDEIIARPRERVRC